MISEDLLMDENHDHAAPLDDDEDDVRLQNTSKHILISWFLKRHPMIAFETVSDRLFSHVKEWSESQMLQDTVSGHDAERSWVILIPDESLTLDTILRPMIGQRHDDQMSKEMKDLFERWIWWCMMGQPAIPRIRTGITEKSVKDDDRSDVQRVGSREERREGKSIVFLQRDTFLVIYVIHINKRHQHEAVGGVEEDEGWPSQRLEIRGIRLVLPPLLPQCALASFSFLRSDAISFSPFSLGIIIHIYKDRRAHELFITFIGPRLTECDYSHFFWAGLGPVMTGHSCPWLILALPSLISTLSVRSLQIHPADQIIDRKSMFPFLSLPHRHAASSVFLAVQFLALESSASNSRRYVYVPAVLTFLGTFSSPTLYSRPVM